MNEREELQEHRQHLLVEQHALKKEISQNVRFLGSTIYAINFIENEIRLCELVIFCQTGKYPK